jgi:hypothetical protein
VRASLSTLVTTLARVPPASAPLRTAQQRANAALSQLVALSAKWPANSPDDYRDNLAGHVTALEEALKTGEIERLTTTVESVAEIRDQAQHCTKSGGLWAGRSSFV